MKPHILRHSALFAALLIVPISSQAQTAAKVGVRAAMLPGAGVPERFELMPDGKGDPVQVEVGGSGFSAEIRLPRMETWKFGRRVEGVDGKNSLEEVGSVAPPEGKSLWLVFCKDPAGTPMPPPDEPVDGEETTEKIADDVGQIEAKEEPAPDLAEEVAAAPRWAIHAIAVDSSSLGEGGIVVLNLSKNPVELELDDQKRELNAGAVELIQPPAGAGEQRNVKFFAIQNGVRRPFVTTNWFMGKGRRRLAAVVQDGGAAVPKLLIVDEIAPRKEDR